MDALKERMHIHEDNKKIKKSPFMYREGLTWKEEGGRKSGVLSLKKMVVTGKIGEMELHVMEGLGRYGFLGGYMLRRYIALQTETEPEREPLRRRLRWMMEKGLVRQYEFFDGKNGSSFIYSLDDSGLRFLRMTKGADAPEKLPEMEPERVLNRLVCSQFMIFLQSQYASCIRDVEEGEESSFILKLPGNREVEIYVFAVRDSGHYKKYYLNHLRNILAKTDGEAVVFVFCESEYQAMECARYRGGDVRLAEMDVYYLLDTFGVSEDVLGRLIEVFPGHDYTEKQMFRLEL